jgi:uncharacterized delta-60 repeat protein
MRRPQRDLSRVRGRRRRGRRAFFALACAGAGGLLAMSSAVSATAAPAPGSLDTAFGTGGKALTSLGVNGGVPSDSILQSDGDILVGGTFGIARFLPDGQLDTTFGSGGFAAVSLPFDGENPSTLAVQPDGKIIWAGTEGNPNFVPGGTFQFAVARFNPNGTLDAGFGTNGVATTEFFSPPLQGAQEFADAVVVQPDGKILVAGSARQGQNKFAPIQAAIARFDSNGTLDTSFGTAGRVLSASHGAVAALGLDAAGDIFVLPDLAEFSLAGQADAAVTPAAITTSSHGGDAAFLASGQFVIGSSVGVAKHDVDVQVQRFNADGSVASTSPTFDYSGATGIDQGRDGASAVAVQANGQALVGGSHFQSTAVFGLARVNADGTLDPAFGTGGTVLTSIHGDDAIDAILVQPDGKIIAVGFSENNSTGVVFIALARYNA